MSLEPNKLLILIRSQNVRNCFNDVPNILWLYGVAYMVKDHSDNKKFSTATSWATLFEL